MMTDFVLSEIRKIVGPIKERTLSEHLARVKSRYIFIFDNLDLAYTEFCKRFVEGEDSVQGIIGGLRYLSCLKYLISVMQNSHRPGGINAPSALFCMRVDTMLLLSKAADRIGEPRLNERYQQYTLADFDTQIVCKNFLEIVSKRGNLACALLDRCEENGSKTQVSEFLAQLTQAEELRFRRYINLSVQGMRTSISSLCRYISQPGVPTGAVFNALCNNYKTEALGFFNGKEEYAQSRTNITNIFLVNAEYRRQSPSSIYPKGLKLEAYGHHHTYWLKYFILAFIAARSGEGIDPVSFDEVIDVFTDDCGYDRDLVALIIYSLTEIEHGRLVRPRSHDSSRLIALTSRGSEFVREGIAVAWSPAYLSTILEDEWLELPARIRDDLMLFGTDAFWDRESFGIYLENKFRAVVRFVICLEQALKYEGECRPRTISRLMAVDGFKSYLPRFSTVIQAVREEFQAQAAELNKDRQSELTSEMDVFLESKVIIQEIEALKGELQPLYRYRM